MNIHNSIPIVAPKWKQPRFPSADDWIEKIQNIPIIEYYLAIKRNEVLIFATAWMNLENMLSKRNQSKKWLHIIEFHLYAISGIGRSQETGRKLVVISLRWVKVEKRSDTQYRVSFRGIQKVLRLDYDGCTTLWIY